MEIVFICRYNGKFSYSDTVRFPSLTIFIVFLTFFTTQYASADMVSLTPTFDGSVHIPGVVKLATCDIPTNDPKGTGIRAGNEDLPAGVYRGYVEWDISSISDSAIITDVSFSWQSIVDSPLGDPDIVSVDLRPSISSATEIYKSIEIGTVLVDEGGKGTFPGSVKGIGTIDLGSLADSALQARLIDDWFAIGFLKDGDEDITCLPLLDDYDEIASTEAGLVAPTLIVTFTPPPQSVFEGVAISDSVSVVVGFQRSFSETLAISDSLSSFQGSLIIRTQEAALVPGATYSITPNPRTGIGILVVTDGGAGDDDGSLDGLITISNALAGSYGIIQTLPPPGFVPLVDSVLVTLDNTSPNVVATFDVAPVAADLSQLPETPISSPPLSEPSFNDLVSKSTTIVTTTTSDLLAAPSDLPGIIVVGTSNLDAINAAIESIASLSVDIIFAELTPGADIISQLGLPLFDLPASPDLVAIIPGVVSLEPTSQVVATPPLNITAGQNMIIAVVDPVIPSTGGLKEMEINVSPTAVSIGVAPQEWFVVETRAEIPAAIPPLSASGISNVVELFIFIKFPFEELGAGFDWSDPDNFSEPPLVSLLVDKPTSTSIQTDAAGCPVVDVFFFDTSINKWTTKDVSIISTSSVGPSTCEVIVSAEHFSRLSVASRLKSSSDSGPSSAPSSAAKSGSGGGGGKKSTLGNIGAGAQLNLVLSGKLSNPLSAQSSILPGWFREQAAWWSLDLLSDGNFAKGIRQLINSHMIDVTISPTDGDQKIPSWVKKNAAWWSNGLITDHDFALGTKYLISQGIIKL